MTKTSDGGYAMSGGSGSHDGDATINHGTYDFWVVKLASDNSTGINETKTQEDISIYPNPASTLLNIHQSIPSPNQQLIITDLLGTEVYKELLTGIDNTISISTWSAGLYFYEVRSTNESARGKFVIQK